MSTLDGNRMMKGQRNSVALDDEITSRLSQGLHACSERTERQATPPGPLWPGGFSTCRSGRSSARHPCLPDPVHMGVRWPYVASWMLRDTRPLMAFTPTWRVPGEQGGPSPLLEGSKNDPWISKGSHLLPAADLPLARAGLDLAAAEWKHRFPPRRHTAW